MEKQSYQDSSAQLKIDFDRLRKVFFLKACIFQVTQFSKSVKRYALSRENHFFKPHRTFYSFEMGKIYLNQELPFEWGEEPTLKEQVYAFQKLAMHSKHMLNEMELEDKLELVSLK